MTLTDTILRGDHETQVRLVGSPCAHLGDRTGQRTEQQCAGSSARLPVYNCNILGLCSPFACALVVGEIAACPCERYERTPVIDKNRP